MDQRMDIRYEAYCLADPLFYDTPAVSAASAGEFAVAARPLPAGWARTLRADWVLFGRPDTPLPEQGWKIHVSAVPENAERVLDTVWDYCTARRVAFKCLRSRQIFTAQNGKYADRGGSGKFITIYPGDAAELERVLRELGDLLDGEPGPYILSDLRWQSGPLYVRYGGFRERTFRTAAGELALGIEAPDGTLTPDRRDPSFHLPEWVSVPPFLAESMSARSARTGGEFPYRIERALHFSNAGGIYVGSDPRTGQPVLIKEARPYAGLDGSGTDAVARLERERRALARLTGLACVPALIEHRTCWEHHFLVREYVNGDSLRHLGILRNPILRPDPTPAGLAEYAEWALDRLDRVERGLDELHARGVVIGDLHPDNILVRPDGSIAFIDFELAMPVAEARRPPLGAPGYIAPRGYEGFAIDRYALGCVRLGVFMPITPIIRWHSGKVDQLLGVIAEHFPVPPDFAERVRHDLGPRPFGDVAGAPPNGRRAGAAGPAGAQTAAGAAGAAPAGTAPAASTASAAGTGPGAGAGAGAGAWTWPRPTPANWPRIRAAIGEAILASATPDRTDRLFPGDIEQFATPGGGVGLAYGAAGVLWALAETGVGRFPDHEKWLLAAARRLDRPQPGFYDGLAGVAYALDRLGRTDDARDILTLATTAVPGPADLSLYSGLSGIGLNLLHFARRTGDAGYRDLAGEMAERIVALLAPEPAPEARAGLLYGASGPALFLVRLYELTGDERLLDHALVALRSDIQRCAWTPNGTLQLDEGWRVMPYVASGSAGIGMAVHEYLRHRPEPDLLAARDGIRRAANAPFVVGAGLFNGRAGLIACLLHTCEGPQPPPPVAVHLRNIGWHAVPYRGGSAFIGDQLMRLSTDLATGSAGVLLVLHTVLTGAGHGLPFLDREGTDHQANGKGVNGDGVSTRPAGTGAAQHGRPAGHE
jgi:hypothetical protein